jgi:hypothetical protein
MHTNIKEGAYQGYDSFEGRRIRINIVPNGTDNKTSPLVGAVDNMN